MTHQRTVYVIDRELESRRSLTRHLAAIGAEAWPFHSGIEFLEIIDHLMPACILLDMDMEEPGGLEVLRSLSARGIGWPVVALSAQPQLAVAVQAMKLGALDFLEKPVHGAALAEALMPAWDALERSIHDAECRRTAQERVARLTPREVDISLALLSGRANKAVAHEFGISVRTVEMHRAHIMTKLGVRSLAEAALIASRAGLEPNPASLAPRPDERSYSPPPRRSIPAAPAPVAAVLGRRLAARAL
jgi:two-component system response regulator FixJ